VLIGFLRYTRAEVEPAEADHRPSVILARLQDINLVTPVRARFALPNGTSVRVHGHAQDVAMAHGIDLRTISRAPDKRLIRRNRAVVPQSQHLSGEIVWILRPRSAGRIASADAHVNHSIFSEHDP